MFFLRIALLLFSAAPAIVSAETLRCSSNVNGEERVIQYDSRANWLEDQTNGEWTLGLPGRAWNWALGELPICSSPVMISYLSRELPAEEVDGYCLTPDETDNWLLVPGERNFLGRCAQTTCEMVNATKDEVAAIANRVQGAILAANTVATTAGVSVVSHSSGAWILTGNAGYIAGTLGSVGTGLIAILTAPVTLTATAVSVVAIGGAVYVCTE
jgi:hypothetical protein